MKKLSIFTAILFALTMFSCTEDSDDPLVIPTYDNTYILTFETGKTSLEHLDTAFVYTPDVYTSLNGDALSMHNFNDKLYLVNQSGPNFITQLDDETLQEDRVVATSEMDNPSNLLMYSEDNGLVVGSSGSGRRKKYLLAHVDMNTGISEAIDDISEDMLPSNSALLLDNNNVLIADGNELKAMDILSKEISVLHEFSETISGIVRDADDVIWIATEKRTEKASFVKLNADYSIAETVTVEDESINLYKNSILIMSKNSYYAYWSESNSGKIYRFNTSTKTLEEFCTPLFDGVMLTTLVKEHPLTKKVYVLGLEDYFDTEKSVLSIYNEDNSLFKTIKEVGNSPIDIFFSDKAYIAQ